MSVERTASENLASNIISLRLSRGLTQGRLAKIAGVPRPTITNFESGSSNPSLHNLMRVAQSLEVGLEELLAPPIADATLIKQGEFPFKDKGGNLVFNLLPSPIKGLIIEKFELNPHSGFTGIPHLKGSKEYFTCVQGKALVTVTGESFEVGLGDVLIFKGDEKHAYKNLLPSKTMVISIIIKTKEFDSENG